MGGNSRLFVPLNALAFDWFIHGEKRYELRRCRHQYNLDQIIEGRDVELRRGYSGTSLWGKIGIVLMGKELPELLEQVGFRSVLPTASSLDNAIEIAKEFVGCDGPYILFEVCKNSEHQSMTANHGSVFMQGASLEE